MNDYIAYFVISLCQFSIVYLLLGSEASNATNILHRNLVIVFVIRCSDVIIIYLTTAILNTSFHQIFLIHSLRGQKWSSTIYKNWHISTWDILKILTLKAKSHIHFFSLISIMTSKFLINILVTQVPQNNVTSDNLI